MNQIILVPTDFSKNSLIAIRYGIELAHQIQADIHILHAYRPFSSNFQSPLANQADEQRAFTETQSKLAQFMQKLESFPSINVTSSIEKENLVQAINSFISKNNCTLVIMGAHGASETRRELLGNNTYDVAKEVSRPLLIVPEHTNSFKLKNVVFFSNYAAGDIKSLQSFNSLFHKVNPTHHLVHIHEGKEKPNQNQAQRIIDWKSSLEKETAVTNIRTEILHETRSVEVVNMTLDRLEADMTLITLIERGFFKKLIHKSLARDIVLNPKTPVLITPNDK